MTVLTLSKIFQANHLIGLENLSEKEHFKQYIQNDKSFINLVNATKTILAEDQHIVIRGLVNNSEKFFEAFVEEFGVYYGVIERTGIKLDCNYTGCNRKALGLHNDDAIDVNNQPKFGFIQVTKPDPILKVGNGVVIIKDIVRKLKFENPRLLEALLATSVPMLSYGVNYIGGEDKEIIVNSPILYIKEGSYQVRFDDSRVAHYYYKKGLKQSHQELDMIESFIKAAHEVKRVYYLECGDVIIVNNLTTLHDRSECSLEIDLDGSFNTREIMVSFAR
jgi:hypothetical protein